LLLSNVKEKVSPFGTSAVGLAYWAKPIAAAANKRGRGRIRRSMGFLGFAVVGEPG